MRTESGEEMETPDCLSIETLELWAQGTLPAAERDASLAHVEACGLCRERAGALAMSVREPAMAQAPLALGPSKGEPTAPSPLVGEGWGGGRKRRRWFAGSLAAAALVAVVLGVRFFGSGNGTSERPFRLPPGQAVSGREDRIAAAADPASMSLPDGTRLRLAPMGELRFSPPAAGERVVVHLVRGTLEAEVVKGTGAFRIVGDAGEIRVVGTTFTAKAFRIYQGSGVRGQGSEGDKKATPSPLGGEGRGEGVIAVLSVEVSEGSVDLASPRGTVRVAAGRRGIAWGRETPVLQEARPMDWRAAVARWGKEAQTSPWARVNLLAGSWEGFSDWEAVLKDRNEDASLRRVAAILVGARAEPRDEEILRGLVEVEGDEEVRKIIKAHLNRIEGEESGVESQEK